jgi:intein/homing endonuclease
MGKQRETLTSRREVLKTALSGGIFIFTLSPPAQARSRRAGGTRRPGARVVPLWCFSGDTKIVMADGSRKLISRMRRGDKIRSFDFCLDRTAISVVADVHESLASSHMILNDNIKVTGKHPFAVGMDVWKRAERLRQGDRIIGQGRDVRVRSVRKVRKPETVFNLSIEHPNNFYVSDGGDSYLVHNKRWCFAGDTNVMMADGTRKPISKLRTGEKVLSFELVSDKNVTAVITDVHKSTSPSHLLLNNKIKVTGKHPFAVGMDVWKRAEQLQQGDRIIGQGGDIRVRSVRKVREPETVFNLSIEHPNNFYVSDGDESYLVHNKRWCFAGDANVMMADGTRRPISKLRVGEKVLSFELVSDKNVTAVITDVHKSTSPSHLLLNDKIKVTGKHPFAVGMDVWKRAEQLQQGDRIIGQGGDIRVRSVRKVREPQTVFNLSVDGPNNFYVSDGSDSYLVHNKKGGRRGLWCFVKGSKVRMADGRLRTIESVKPGDRVKGFDLRSEKWGSYPVTQIEVASRDRGYYLINKTLKVTSAHRLCVDGCPKAAAELTLGDRLSNGRRPIRVTSIELVKEKAEKYNLVLGKNSELAYSVDGVLVMNEYL